MNDHPFPPVRRSLIVKFTFWMLLCALFLIPLLAGFQMWQIYLREITEQKQNLTAVAQAFKHPLEVAVWNEDAVSIEAQLGSIVLFPGVAFARLSTDIGHDTEGRRFVAGLPATAGETLTIGLQEPGTSGPGRELGKLELKADEAALHANMMRQAIEIVSTATLEVLCLSLLLTMAVRHLVSNRITTFVRQVQRLGDDLDFQPLVEAKSPDELGLLAHGINHMQLQLRKHFAEVRKLRDELLMHHDHLEALVEERTRALTTTNQALQTAKLSADMANRLKSDFLANVSHEIRTPMNAVVGFGHMLMKTDLTPEQRDHACKIEEATRDLLRIVNDLLDFSQIESGTLTLEERPFDCLELLDDLRRTAQAKGEKKGLCITLEVMSRLPRQLQGDPVRLLQVLSNLVDNAIKFTRHGAVTITASGKTGEDGRFLLDIAIKDSGIGMSDDQITGLFQPFVQVDGSFTRRFGGTGLGLAICRHLLDLMQGDIRVESAIGVGSTFYVHVPCHLCDPAADAGSERAAIPVETAVSSPIAPAGGVQLDAGVWHRAQEMLGRLEQLMAAADPEAGELAKALFRLLEHSPAAATAQRVSHLADAFDFEEATLALGPLRQSLTAFLEEV
ncbi:MAG: HAMP domain-containing protein [Magnetococcales bacterium]|nr:HAMP domain-containing protein [Magnetococcales bacterium]